MQFCMFQVESYDSVAYVSGDVADFFPAPSRINAADQGNQPLHISTLKTSRALTLLDAKTGLKETL